MEPTEQSFPNSQEKASEPALLPPESLSIGEQFSVDLNSVNSAIEALLTRTSTDPSDIKELWLMRDDLARCFIESIEPTPEQPHKRARVQCDILIDKALIFEKTGDMTTFLEGLDEALYFARKNDLYDIIDSLKDELDEKTEELGSTPAALLLKLRSYTSFENRYFLRELLSEGIDYDDFISNVYGMILSEGCDPDEVLKLLGITE